MKDAEGKDDIPIEDIRTRWDELLASMQERTSVRVEQGARGLLETEWNSQNFPLPLVFTGGPDAWKIKQKGDDNLLDISAGRGRDSNMTETGQLKYHAGVPLETSKWKMPRVKREPSPSPEPPAPEPPARKKKKKKKSAEDLAEFRRLISAPGPHVADAVRAAAIGHWTPEGLAFFDKERAKLPLYMQSDEGYEQQITQIQEHFKKTVKEGGTPYTREDAEGIIKLMYTKKQTFEELLADTDTDIKQTEGFKKIMAAEDKAEQVDVPPATRQQRSGTGYIDPSKVHVDSVDAFAEAAQKQVAQVDRTGDFLAGEGLTKIGQQTVLAAFHKKHGKDLT